ncbi:D-alanyl-D-alanine carboxypeptidase [Brevirhabdus pacifica]|uniref:serine-type D-Ala-D-Ala carboxypeptidase n=1 Tax=Brevirhabdus pacifica TaxID=1267768 RepID=A0A1U7DHA6_9RHOB|nr:D-alanyl-D-alanine carboxypeptidase family protein [Brevirhabdus pacifica]APX89273.1 D-alanyl-D-alanine carboxypeptidase [Brevirhabdus pacifica]OWU76688.1 D-Ala-D-Ala carboxypeptidase [Loktanella sp. 22II-4b]PJJ86113.1 D-alanyl-D-alanine carboxypeptidase (penicillin-binding protein 5/6) [Brevirhabdus pacifica]
MLNRISPSSLGALCAAIVLSIVAALPLRAYETAATGAYVFDVNTGTVILEKNSEVPLPPASMSKLMTLYMLFEALRDGRVTMDTRFGVSSKAKSMGGSTMFLNERDRPSVEELIQGIIVLSGNDACVVVAEGLAGSESAFARTMNEKAEALGMTGSNFVNASGWPDPEHRMSMKDLGILARHLISEFPEYYGYFSQKEFEFDGRAPQNRFNRNPLLSLGIGADGLKTGHTNEAGYGLVGSAAQGTRRIVFVITGLSSEKERAEESERIVNWAFRQFVEKTLFDADTQLATADLWLGAKPQVGLVTEKPLTVLVPAGAGDTVEARVEYEGPIQAPIKKGQKIGELVVAMPDQNERRIPLLAQEAVASGGFGVRLKTAAKVLFHKVAGEAAVFN